MADYDVPQVVTCRLLRESKKYKYENPSSDSLPEFSLQPNPKKDDHYYYGVRIVTGSHSRGGLNWRADVHVTLVGSKAKTNGDSMLGWWEFLPSRHMKYDDLVLECSESLGKVQVVILENRASFWQRWYVDFVDVHDFQTVDKQVFPCYHWLGAADTLSFSSSTAAVGDNPILVKFRLLQLEKRKKLYRWKDMKELNMPSVINDSTKIPNDEVFGITKAFQFYSTAITDIVTTDLAGITHDTDHIDGYEVFAKILREPEICTYNFSRWTTDVEFGRQILNGVNPVVIRKCETLPPNFPVTDEMVHSSLGHGCSLKEEMAASHVYLCDLSIMDGLPCRKGTFCAAPLCLLHVNASGQLKPIAIQLSKTPGENSPIFLPSDVWLDWMAAKIHYLSAHAQFHQLSTHYITCHAAMEVYGMALMRNIPDAHPVYKLLRPHVRYTMAINITARDDLLGPTGPIAEVFAIGGEGFKHMFRKAGQKYSVHWSNIKRNVKERGVANSSELPFYHYRDDGFKIWDALEAYVGRIIDHFYPNDAAVAEDKEIKNFVQDVHENGFPGYGENAVNGHDFPTSITTIADLVEILTLIIFTGSAQHAAVNYGQFDHYGFVPNSPFVLHKAPPSRKGEVTHEDLMDALPNKKETERTVAVVHLLSDYSPDDIFLGDFPAEQFVEEEPKIAVEQLRDSLEKVAAEIEERNKQIDIPYLYLHPDRIPNSITI